MVNSTQNQELPFEKEVRDIFFSLVVFSRKDLVIKKTQVEGGNGVFVITICDDRTKRHVVVSFDQRNMKWSLLEVEGEFGHKAKNFEQKVEGINQRIIESEGGKS